MMLVTTALMIEARPIAERLGLKSRPGGAYPLFEGEEFILIVTGTGPVKAAAGTGRAMGRFREIRATVNIGFCGAAEAVSPLYKWYYINAIRHAETDRLSIPDILWEHPFPEGALLTLGRVAREPVPGNHLVDMEGAGFYEAARQCLAPDCIALLKWVSDPMSGKIDTDRVLPEYVQSLDAVIGFLRDWPAGKAGMPGNDRCGSVLETVTDRLRLTESQYQFLKKWIAGYITRGGDPQALVDVLPQQTPPGKPGNKAIFERLKDVLKS